MLEFTARGRRLRITCSPQWEAPRRGGGTTTRNARVVLQEQAGGRWEGRSTRIDETAHFIRGLLGMDRTQFCQVAMLPQGEFAGFLRAEAKVRADLLEKVPSVRGVTAHHRGVHMLRVLGDECRQPQEHMGTPKRAGQGTTWLDQTQPEEADA